MQGWGPGSSHARRNAVEAEASRRLARLQTYPDIQYERDIGAWIESDSRHAIAFARAEAAWEAADRLKGSAAAARLHSIDAHYRINRGRRLSRDVLIAAGAAIILFLIR